MLKRTLRGAAARRPTACDADHPYVITWWCDRGTADDSEHCRAGFASLTEAEEYVAFLGLDPATGAITRDWLRPIPDAIPF